METQTPRRGSSTYSMVKQLLETANIQIAYERLYACGVQDSVFENIVLTEKTVNNNYLLFMMVPMLLAILLTTGGVSIATDSLAGEHDRGTLERIASTSVRMTDILSGKILAIIVVAMAPHWKNRRSTLFCLCCFSLQFTLHLSQHCYLSWQLWQKAAKPRSLSLQL